MSCFSETLVSANRVSSTASMEKTTTKRSLQPLVHFTLAILPSPRKPLRVSWMILKSRWITQQTNIAYFRSGKFNLLAECERKESVPGIARYGWLRIDEIGNEAILSRVLRRSVRFLWWFPEIVDYSEKLRETILTQLHELERRRIVHASLHLRAQ